MSILLKNCEQSATKYAFCHDAVMRIENFSINKPESYISSEYLIGNAAITYARGYNRFMQWPTGLVDTGSSPVIEKKGTTEPAGDRSRHCSPIISHPVRWHGGTMLPIFL
jgi:hypothetical protein